MAYVKTDTLIGPALDWAVAKVQENPDQVFVIKNCNTLDAYVGGSNSDSDSFVRDYSPSTNWSQGGAIIDQERYTFATIGTGPVDPVTGFEPVVCIGIDCLACEGPTHLIAAMRCLVRNCLGDEVDVPEALV